MLPPEHALDLLSERIGRRCEDVSFMRVGSEITAKLDRDHPIAMTRDERIHTGRRLVLDAVGEICDRSPELKLDWYAVSPAR
jgi:hypothetical protein